MLSAVLSKKEEEKSIPYSSSQQPAVHVQVHYMHTILRLILWNAKKNQQHCVSLPISHALSRHFCSLLCTECKHLYVQCKCNFKNHFLCFCSLPGLPKDFVPKDTKLLLPKDFQPNKEFHPKIGNDDDDDDDDITGDGSHGDDDGEQTHSFPSMPGSLPRTNAGHGELMLIKLLQNQTIRPISN